MDESVYVPVFEDETHLLDVVDFEEVEVEVVEEEDDGVDRVEVPPQESVEIPFERLVLLVELLFQIAHVSLRSVQVPVDLLQRYHSVHR